MSSIDSAPASSCRVASPVTGSPVTGSSGAGSVTGWLDSLRKGSDEAANQLWDLYFHRLVMLARKQLGKTPRAEYDEEDVALSAIKSIFDGVRRGSSRVDMDREALWRFMATVTLRKVYDFIAYRKRLKRDPLKDSGGQVIGLDHPEVIQSLISQEPTPELTAEFDDSFEEMLAALSRPDLRQVVLLKLEGYTNQEIATELGRGLSTIERKLKTIRQIWQNEFVPESAQE